MILRGRGNTSTDMLTLKALQAGVAAAVDKSGLPPPVIIAHSIAVRKWSILSSKPSYKKLSSLKLVG